MEIPAYLNSGPGGGSGGGGGGGDPNPGSGGGGDPGSGGGGGDIGGGNADTADSGGNVMLIAGAAGGGTLLLGALVLLAKKTNRSNESQSARISAELKMVKLTNMHKTKDLEQRFSTDNPAFVPESHEDEVHLGMPRNLQAKFNFVAENEDELSVQKGDVILGISQEGEWWHAENPTTKQSGLVPANVFEEFHV